MSKAKLREKQVNEIASLNELDAMLRRHSIEFGSLGSVDDMTAHYDSINKARNGLSSLRRDRGKVYRRLRDGVVSGDGKG